LKKFQEMGPRFAFFLQFFKINMCNFTGIPPDILFCVGST
jgi:hypothetical protein